LPREQRLTDAAGFSLAVRRGRRAGGKLLVVHVGDSDEPGTRIGFIVSKAVGNAVVRNRVKRRLRHLVRERLGDLPEESVLVVRAQPAAAAASYAELRGELDRCLGRVPGRVPGRILDRIPGRVLGTALEATR
jgi:ribonuclease P protein component